MSNIPNASKREVHLDIFLVSSPVHTKPGQSMQLYSIVARFHRLVRIQPSYSDGQNVLCVEHIASLQPALCNEEKKVSLHTHTNKNSM